MPELTPKSLATLRSEAPAAQYNGSEIIHVSQGGVSKGGLLNQGVQTMTGSATVADGCRLILLNAASGTVTVPTTVPVGQDVEFIKIHASAGTWTGARSGSETFAGATSFTLTEQYERQVWTKVTSTRYERKLWTLGAQEYEVGTFTPAITGSTTNPTNTYSAQVGTYVRMGSKVLVQMRIQWSASSGGSGNVRINLPFAAMNTSNGALGALHLSQVDYSTYSNFAVAGITGSASLLVLMGKDGTVNLEMPVSQIQSGSFSKEFRIVIEYQTT